jgi:hypothetical protein
LPSVQPPPPLIPTIVIERRVRISPEGSVCSRDDGGRGDRIEHRIDGCAHGSIGLVSQ